MGKTSGLILQTKYLFSLINIKFKRASVLLILTIFSTYNLSGQLIEKEVYFDNFNITFEGYEGSMGCYGLYIKLAQNKSKSIYTLIITDGRFPQRISGFDEVKGKFGEYNYKYKAIISTKKYPLLDNGYHIYSVKPLSYFFNKDYTYDEKLSKIGFSLFTISRQSMFTTEQIEKVVITPIDDKSKIMLDQKRDEILAKNYNLKDYDLKKYNEFKSRVIEIFEDAFKEISIEYSNYSPWSKILSKSESIYGISTYSYIWNNSPDKKIRDTISSIVYIKSNSDGRMKLDLEKISNDIKPMIKYFPEFKGMSSKYYSYFDTKYNLNVDGYDVNVVAEIPILIEYAKGITEVRIRKGEFQFIKYTPYNDLVENIKNDFIEKLKYSNKFWDNASYTVLYTYAKIMDEDWLHIEYERK